MDFSLLNLKGLKSECKDRGLPTSGNIPDLLLRLKEDEDKRRAQDAGSPQICRNASLPNRSRSAPQLASPTRTNLADLTEADLEQICRDSFLPKTVIDQIPQRDADVKNEFIVKRDDLIKKREDSIKRAENKCAKDIEKLVKERDNKLDENTQHRDKQKKWYPAFSRLKHLKLARGAHPPHPSDFDPSRRPPTPPSMAPSPAAISPLNSQAAAFRNSGAPSPPASSALNSQAAAFRKSSAPSPSAASTATMKSSATMVKPSTMGTATPVSNKRRAWQMDDNEDTFYRTAPSGPRNQTPFQPGEYRISPTPKFRAQLSNNTSHIFVSARDLPVQLRYIEAMYDILDQDDEFRVSRIRGDPEGYYWIFDSERGDEHAALCFGRFQGRLFDGRSLQLELRVAGPVV